MTACDDFAWSVDWADDRNLVLDPDKDRTRVVIFAPVNLAGRFDPGFGSVGESHGGYGSCGRRRDGAFL